MPAQTPVKEKEPTVADSDKDQKRHKEGKEKKKSVGKKILYTLNTKKIKPEACC